MSQTLRAAGRAFRFVSMLNPLQEGCMAIKDIKAFADQARSNPELKDKLAACQKIRELLTLAKEAGFALDEQELYPPNEPQFTEDQLSERLAKALLRA